MADVKVNHNFLSTVGLEVITLALSQIKHGSKRPHSNIAEILETRLSRLQRNGFDCHRR